MKPIIKSVLLATSSATDALNSGGYLNITGLIPVPKKSIVSIKQIKYRAEVAQVVTVASSDDIVASTLYSVSIFDPNRKDSGWEESKKTYSQLAPPVVASWGGSAALRREYLNGLLIDKINADGTNHSVAVTLGSGNGFTITDDGGYYPVKSQSMTNVKGPNIVLANTNTGGSGFTDANITVSTAAVISSGVGAILASQAPVTDNVFGGNLISGILEGAPLTTAGAAATSGQKYDAFVVASLSIQDTPSITGHYTYIDSSQTVWVDNGTGSSVTNLAGFVAFQREMRKEIGYVYQNDKNAIAEFFDKGYVMQANPGITPYTGTIAGTADVMKYFTTPYGTKLEHYNINAQTIFAPLEVAAGLQIEQDLTATDGVHYSAGTLALAPNSFVVGKQEFMVCARVVASDWTDTFFMVGFRKKAAYAADFNSYTDLGAIGTQTSGVSDFVATQGILNNAATVETVSASAIAADSVAVDLIVKVAINGTVTAYRNGTAFPIYSVGTTTLVFDAGDEMIPFFQYLNLNSAASGLTFSELLALPTTSVIS